MIIRSRLKSGVRHDAVHQTAEPTVAMVKALFGGFIGCCISGSIFLRCFSWLKIRKNTLIGCIHPLLRKLRSQVDSKLHSEIEEKKRAHGLKTDRSVQSNDDSEEEYYGISM